MLPKLLNLLKWEELAPLDSADASQPEDEEDEQVDKEGVEEKNSFCHHTSNIYSRETN